MARPVLCKVSWEERDDQRTALASGVPISGNTIKWTVHAARRATTWPSPIEFRFRRFLSRRSIKATFLPKHIISASLTVLALLDNNSSIMDPSLVLNMSPSPSHTSISMLTYPETVRQNGIEKGRTYRSALWSCVALPAVQLPKNAA